MKKLLFIIAVSALVGIMVKAGQSSTTPKTISIYWDYPADDLDTNLTFRIYASTDIGVPLTNWPVLTNVVGTNLVVQVAIQPGKMFFYLTASNFWGESFPSTVAVTPALPHSDSKISISRAD